MTPFLKYLLQKRRLKVHSHASTKQRPISDTGSGVRLPSRERKFTAERNSKTNHSRRKENWIMTTELWLVFHSAINFCSWDGSLKNIFLRHCKNRFVDWLLFHCLTLACTLSLSYCGCVRKYHSLVCFGDFNGEVRVSCAFGGVLERLLCSVCHLNFTSLLTFNPNLELKQFIDRKKAVKWL